MNTSFRDANTSTDKDIVRLNSLQNNGTSSWIILPANNYYGKKYDNFAFHMNLSLYLGSPIMHNAFTCKQCNQQNCNEYHAFHCNRTGTLTWRHYIMAKKALGPVFKQAGFKIKYEQSPDERQDRPGDIYVYNWFNR